MIASVPEVVEPAPVAGSTRFGRWSRPIWMIVGTVLLTVGGVLPVWGTRLLAPQYPKGLSLWVYGGKVTGDVREINSLNHYIGMRTLDVSTVPELRLWPWVVVLTVALFLAAMVLRGGWRKMALVALWAVPVGVLADIERWLIIFGRNLDERAALRLEPFVPLVMGPTKIWNFDVWSYPGPALGGMVAAALIATLIRRSAHPSNWVGGALAAGLLGANLVATVLWVIPSLAVEVAAEAGQTMAGVGRFDLASAVREAEPGSTLIVPAGHYRLNLVIDVPLTLIGEEGAVIDGDGQGSVVTIEADDVTFRGWVVTGSGGQVEDAAGIKVLGDRVSVEHTRVERSYTGISVQGAEKVRLVDNVIMGIGQVEAGATHAMGGHDETPGAALSGQGDGISLWNVDAGLVRGNHIEEVRDGIYLNFVTEILVDTNIVTASRYALHAMSSKDLTVFGNEMTDNLAGTVLMFTKGVEIARNQITDSRSEGAGVGVVLKDVSKVRVIENVIARNRVGIQTEGTTQIGGEAAVVRNRVSSNRIGVAMSASSDILFGSNSFEDNLTQVWALEPGVERHNTWSYHGVGNEWSDYAGYDLAADGLGDVPHIAGGAVQALVAAAPALEAYRMSPAYRLLEASQAWWSLRRPVVEDRHPLTEALAPPALPGRPGDAPIAWYGLGWVLVAGAIALRTRMSSGY